jgi:hypothetical protein
MRPPHGVAPPLIETTKPAPIEKWQMSKISRALDELRDAIFAAHHTLATERKCPPRTEYVRRQSALRSIDNILEQRPLIQFSAAQLELLESAIAYIRELEVEGNPRVPEPLGPEGVMSIWQSAPPPTCRFSLSNGAIQC